MRIIIVASHCVPFHAGSLAERPLGGSETAIVRLAEALHARGHSVSVVTPYENPPASEPHYVSLDEFNRGGVPECDVLVAARDWRPLILPVQADLRLFWTGDSHDVEMNFGIGDPRVEERIDGILLNSEWHARELCHHAAFPREKAWIIGCGVHIPDFEQTEVRKRKRLIYSSAPVRGLALLPRIYERIRRRHPDAELHVFAGFDTYRDGPGGNHEGWNSAWRSLGSVLEAMPGCTVHGNVRQERLAREFMQSAVLAYPNTFDETFCVTAAEAQAAGCAVVASSRAALPETVGEAGILISGLPGSAGYEDDFVEAVDRLLADDKLFGRLSRYGFERARAQFDWRAIAARFESYLAESIERSRAERRRAQSRRGRIRQALPRREPSDAAEGAGE